MIALVLAWQVTAAMPLLQKGQFADARPLLEKACNAKEANGCYLLGRTLFTLDQYDNALRVLTPLIATDPAPWRVHDALGSVFEALRRPADAERSYQDAVRGNQDATADPRYHFGRFLIREGRAEEAITILRPAAQKFRDNPLVRFELGRAYYLTREMENAEAELQAASALEEARRLLQKVRRLKGN